jgi:hypothetical protein
LETPAASNPKKTIRIMARASLAEITDVLNGRETAKQERVGIPSRLVHRDFPAGILSRKDALDDGNAYGSAIDATADGRITWQVTIGKTPMLLTSGTSCKARRAE